MNVFTTVLRHISAIQIICSEREKVFYPSLPKLLPLFTRTWKIFTGKLTFPYKSRPTQLRISKPS